MDYSVAAPSFARRTSRVKLLAGSCWIDAHVQLPGGDRLLHARIQIIELPKQIILPGFQLDQ